MAFTLFDLLLETYKRLGQLRVGVVDSGSTTTVVDAMQSSDYNEGVEIDAYLGGGIFNIYNAAGASAAPQGEFAPITAFDPDTGTFTHDAFSSTNTVGDKYGYTTTLFPFLDSIEHANSALKVIGDVEYVNTTTLTTDSSHSEYPIAVGWKRQIVSVDYQGSDSDANDNQWQPLSNWDVIPAAGGTAGNLILPYLSTGYAVRVKYMGPHPRLSVHDDPVNESIDPELMTQATIVQMLEAYVSMLGDSAMDTIWPQRLSDARTQLQKWEMLRPPPKHRKKGRVWIMSDNYGDADDGMDVEIG
jgi:hypothetical protein